MVSRQEEPSGVGVDITEKSEPWWGIKEVLEAGGIAA